VSQFPVNDEVILASAGSGKTYALSDRIVKLLACQKLREGEVRPEQIVALTFTRAAAAEFMARTLEKLAKAASSEKEAADLRRPDRLDLPETCDAAFFRELLRKTLLSMQRLTLGTLDSFFARLVTNNPTEVGLDGGSIRNISEVEAEDIRTQVIAQMMAETAPEQIDEIWGLLRSLNQGKEVATPLKGLAETAAKLQDLITLAREDAKWGVAETIWKQGVPEIFRRPSGAETKKAAGDLLAWLSGADFHKTLMKSLAGVAEAIGDMTSASDLKPSIWDNLEGRLRPIILGKTGDDITLIYPAGEKGRPIHLPVAACDNLRVLGRTAYSIALQEKLAQTKAMYRLLERYDEIYDREIRQRGRLTFSDNVTLLLDAEGKFDIDYRLDCSVKHWLFDEFQDTSTRQWKVLEKNLTEIYEERDQKTEWRTTFFVGDLKQSLYGWRAGNPELLRMVDAKIPKTGNNRRDYTRRCARPVVDMVNRLLGDLEPHGRFFSTEAAAKWGAVWGDHESKNPDRPESGEALWVRLNNLEETVEAKEGDEGDEDTGKAACQAKWIGAHIRHSGLLDGNNLLKPGITCAVLVSKNEQAAEITEQLRRMGIEAADEAAAEIAMDNPFTAGVVSLIKNAAHPTDRLSKGMAEMSPSAKAYVDACGGWEPARLRMAEVFYERGGEALLQELLRGRMPDGETNAERFLAKRVQQILALAVKFDEDERRDLARFATHLEKSSLRDTADPRSVQVLTIHRSKGLQYTAVYLPCLNSEKQKITQVRVKDPLVKTDAEFTPEWVLTRPKTAVCEADPGTLNAVLTEERTAAAYENLCRLYVGMTRAIRRLVLVTDELKPELREDLTNEKLERKYDFATLVEAILGGTDGAGIKGKKVHLRGACEAEIMFSQGSDDWIGAAAAKTETVSEAQAVRDISVLTPVQRTERLRPSKSGKPFAGGWKPGKDVARGKVYGTLVHELFNHLEWDAEAFLRDLERRAWPVEIPDLYDEAAEAIAACLKSKPVAELLRKTDGAVLWNERKATLMHEGKVINAVFDRVQVIPGESATVIDYKTNDCSLEHLKEMYQGQMDLYRIAVAKLCGLEAGKVRCVLVHVRTGALVEC